MDERLRQTVRERAGHGCELLLPLIVAAEVADNLEPEGSIPESITRCKATD